VIHGNYWLSGVVGHHLKHELDVPFVSTFHTLARIKAAARRSRTDAGATAPRPRSCSAPTRSA
jgi:hypothetical protein